MKPTEPLREFPRLIALGDHPLNLPEGLTASDWTFEKIRWQNPRIRAFLGCIRLLGGVLESNYAILHCSPERLREIWGKVRQVGELIRNEMAPLLRVTSRFPAIEEARQHAELFLDILSSSVLADLEGFSAEVGQDQLIKVRKLLCVSIGKLHSFLQDAFGEIMASDPRSLHNAPAPAPAPSVASESAKQLASFSIRTGRPSRAARSRSSGRPTIQVELAFFTRPLAGETVPGMPIPTLPRRPVACSSSATRPWMAARVRP